MSTRPSPAPSGRPRVVVAGLGDTGVLVATRLARSCDVVGVSTRPALVSGQELGNRLTDPTTWRRSYLVPYRRFRRLDQVRTRHGRITSVDLTGRQVHLELADGSAAIEPYDVLVIATGASNGFWRHDRVEDLAAIDADLASATDRLAAAATIAVVGGGATGVSVADSLARRGAADVHLFHSGDEPLPGYHPKVRRWIVDRLRSDGVTVHPGHRAVVPDGFAGDRLTTEPVAWATGQPPFAADLTLWAVGRVRPHSGFLPAEVLDADGFVLVDEHLRVPGHPEVFAVGDVAASDPNRSSARNWGWRVVVANVRAAVRGRPPTTRFHAPEHRWGSILGLQDDGMVVVQPDGRRFRVPRWAAEPLLFRLFVTHYLYGGLRRGAPRRAPDASAARAGYGARRDTEEAAMAAKIEVGPAAELTPGTVTGAGAYAVGNAGDERFAVTRRCRHLRADLAHGTIDADGCLECPWHHATYDVSTGQMVRGPQGAFAKVPGLGAGFRALTRVFPLGRGKVTEQDGTVYVE